MVPLLYTVARIRALLDERHKDAANQMIVISTVLTPVIKEQLDPEKAMQVIIESLPGSLKV